MKIMFVILQGYLLKKIILPFSSEAHVCMNLLGNCAKLVHERYFFHDARAHLSFSSSSHHKGSYPKALTLLLSNKLEQFSRQAHTPEHALKRKQYSKRWL